MSDVGKFIKRMLGMETARERQNRLREEEYKRREKEWEESDKRSFKREIEHLLWERDRLKEELKQTKNNSGQKSSQPQNAYGETGELIALSEQVLTSELQSINAVAKRTLEGLKASPESESTRKDAHIMIKSSVKLLYKHRNMGRQGYNMVEQILNLKQTGVISEKQAECFIELNRYANGMFPRKKLSNPEFAKKLIANFNTVKGLVCNEIKNMLKEAQDSENGNSSAQMPAASMSVNKSGVNLSFKQYENFIFVSDARERYSKIYKCMDKAHSLMADGEYQISLNQSARIGFEEAIRQFIRFASIETERTDSLEDKINMLVKADIISNEQASVFHRVRKLGNAGAHNLGDPTANDAQMAIDGMETVIELLVQNTAEENRLNKPLLDPIEYYSNKRKYYGRWASCENYQTLAMNPSYIELSRRANAGDISAMLDIANGFLGKEHHYWNSVGLLINDRYKKYLDAYDARYYYWVLRACDTAYNCWQRGVCFPLKYIATALLESIKFLLYREIMECNADSKEFAMPNQYTYVEKNMFGNFVGNIYNFADMLIAMMEEYKTDRLVAPMHKENSAYYVKLLMYMKCAYGKYYPAYEFKYPPEYRMAFLDGIEKRYHTYRELISAEVAYNKTKDAAKQEYYKAIRAESLRKCYLLKKEDAKGNLWSILNEYADFVTRPHLEFIDFIYKKYHPITMKNR